MSTADEREIIDCAKKIIAWGALAIIGIGAAAKKIKDKKKDKDKDDE